MSLPVDIPAVLKAATNIEDAAKETISVSVYIDDTAPDDLVGHVRQAFAGAGHNARITVAYIDSADEAINTKDDMSMIAAGTAGYIGAFAAKVRNSGIPVMVATTLPTLVADIASSEGNPIPSADIVAPVKLQGVMSQIPYLRRQAKTELVGEGDEPIALDSERCKIFDLRMGEWMIAACSQRKLALAMAFPFVRRAFCEDAINATSMQNAAVGFVPIIPGADMPIMTLNQIKMMMQIAVAYGEPLDTSRIKELAAVVCNAFVCRSIARSVAKVVPGVGWVASGAMGFTGTQAIGRAAIEYFEVGGNLTGLANVVQAAAAEATDVAKKAADTSIGQRALRAVKSTAASAISGKSKKD